MPFFTQLPGVNLSLDAGLVSIGDNALLNNLVSVEFDEYYFQAADDTTLSNGEPVSLVNDEFDEPSDPRLLSGTYLGSGALSTVNIEVDVLGLTGVQARLSPIEGDFILGNDGRAYFTSDQPLSADNLSVDLYLEAFGLPVLDLTLPLNAPALTDIVDNLLQSVILNIEVDVDGTLVVPPGQIAPCFHTGTLIQTDRGPVAVEELQVGDHVVTRDNGLQPIRWIGVKRLSEAYLARNPHMRAVRIHAGALGDGIPAADLVVSPQHRILVRSTIAQKMFGTNEILVAAKQLLLLDGIEVAEDLATVEYHHFLFDRHEVILSNGAETESLFTGPEALKSIGRAAREEIFGLFPELQTRDYEAVSARVLASGRMGRRLAIRHRQNHRQLVR
mgnify:FL=1